MRSSTLAGGNRLLWLVLILSSVVWGQTKPDFMSVRQQVTKTYESEGHIPTEKYFLDVDVNGWSTNCYSFHHHYDGRFANETLPETQVIPHLSALIQTYFTTMNALHAETWIMHGTLLAWWWNQQIFPWDNDLDVQISEATLHFLADYYNMTEHQFEIVGSGPRTYLLEVNPHYLVKSDEDTLNKIDARWIDMSSGLFIDLTAVRKDEEKRRQGHPEALACKDKHHYDESDIFPLRDTVFEGVTVQVPYAYTYLLEEEYSAKALTQTGFHGYTFNEHTKVWEST